MDEESSSSFESIIFEPARFAECGYSNGRQSLSTHKARLIEKRTGERSVLGVFHLSLCAA